MHQLSINNSLLLELEEVTRGRAYSHELASGAVLAPRNAPHARTSPLANNGILLRPLFLLFIFVITSPQ